MRAYSMDLRIRVLKACDSGLGTTEVAELFDVSTAWIRRLKQRRRETGQIGAREQRHGPLPKLHGHEEELVRIVEEQPDRTAKEIAALLPLCISHQTVDRFVRRLNYRFKKRH
ncbi:MAG: transposase [Pirellulaceae bacterium]|nr:transposase [Pirellulaceae bacterium]MBX3421839.1 transposase [Pirellulaceae bacterium]MBX3422703.1 transposase [Pirellulaceae bacterium]MBX3423966.1 transposase [Pirellulaceae bacterium]